MTLTAQYDRTGGPETLHLAETPQPEPGVGEAVVRVRAAGLNPFDAKLRGGFVLSDDPFPRRICSDVAGTVVAVGDDAVYWDGTAVRVGDDVLGRAAGSAAEQAVARVSDLSKRPGGLSVEAAGGLNVAGLTAVSVIATVPVGAGDTVLVGGATGAVGFVAAQLALAAGATVIGSASPRHHDLLRSVGVVPVAHGPGLADRVRALGAVTAVHDCHGRDALDAGVALGVPVERMVAIAAYDAVDELGVQNVEREARTAANLAALAEEIASGRIAFPVAQVFPLGEIVAAFQTLESSHAPGKIVVVP
ncbi:putative oxidoreductase [Tersicoccus solisilvae]|uniref:Oxidoreductase n=1 Tax=Tersicoccus solisilvae TaxID=1882339 RepID=A0ABQ1NV41_9MICC|nr:NADP-dependent oxidoreductase [Tersicoccus solisilvae]GGC84682.1 putative oxidoreductase [Tersicoccus solisilvae]